MFAEELRTVHGAQMVVLISEIEIGRSIQIIKNKITKPEQHIDVILNSDMHEETLKPIEVMDRTGKKTWILEEGQDGTLIGELNFTVRDGQVTGMTHTPHRIDGRIKSDKRVAKKVAQVRYPFNSGFTPNTHLNPFSGTYLNGPLNQVVGSTQVGLHRSNYLNEAMPAVVEGSSHDFVADAIRWWAKSDLATIRGFRYGTHVAPGPITRNDIFHFAPIGPRIGKAGRVTANQIRNQVDNSAQSVFSSSPNSDNIPRPNYNNKYSTDPLFVNASPGAGLPVTGGTGATTGWGGGWMFAYSADGFHMNLDPYYVPTSQMAPEYDAVNNVINAKPATDTSRARSLTVKVPCKSLPPTELTATGCNVADTTSRYATTLTNSTDGKWMPSWNANYAAPKNVYLLNPDGWAYLQGTANQPTQANAVTKPFQAPTFTVAGYWYAQSPNTINNCNNCYPTGFSNVVGDANAAYLLPVNMNANGDAALDSDGNPKYVRNAVTGAVVMANGKPEIEGQPIDLTLVIEKYLTHLGGQVTAANLPLNRIGLVNPLPVSAMGFRVMQPLCGVVGQNPLAPNACP